MVRHLHSGKIPFVVPALWMACLLAGCSGIKPYPSTPDNNLHLYTTTDSGSFFSSIHAAVDIHRIGSDCTTDYEGTIQLTQPTIDVGIPPNRWSRLVFIFASSSFLANRSGTITYDTLLKPRAGYHYEITASYKSDTYHVAIREIPPNRSTGRELDRLAPSACRSSSGGNKHAVSAPVS